MGVIGRPKLERLISDMEIGEIAYASMHALAFDDDFVPYLNTAAIIDQRANHPRRIKITRVGPGRSEYDVDIRDVNEKWIRERNPFNCVVGVESSAVVELCYTKDAEHTAELKTRFDEQRSYPDSRDEFPETHALRSRLNIAIGNGHYRLAERLVGQINQTNEPL